MNFLIEKPFIALFLILICCFSCQKQTSNYDVKFSDAHSFARPDQVAVKNIDLDLKIDFDKKQLTGRARLTLQNKTATDSLFLDTRDLEIFEVLADGAPTAYRLGKGGDYLGQPLIIAITPSTKTVTVKYATTRASALQWLTPAQTSGGKHPFLFTQSQPILARTWLPCQDSPAVRVTYTARIATDANLMAVMSATNPVEKSADGVYQFEMEQPIPAYLIALAVGDLQFQAIGERSGVYAEAALLEKAAKEFEDTESMMTAAENLYGPYRWERYDMIVLPPSFPYGGMENPRLTFLTPTLLAGDKSLVSTVAHELAHSWSGNLVTNANWNDFWLNEGFTTYFEHRIMEAVYGKTYAEMLASLSFSDLEDKINELGADNPDARLHLDLDGRDPDEGTTTIAYDKGHFFLRTVEKAVGREAWDRFLRGYFDTFAFKPMTSAVFLQYLRRELIGAGGKLDKQLQLEKWIYDSGIPENVNLAKSMEFERVKTEIAAWLSHNQASSLQTNDWTTHHWLYFLRNLPQKLSMEQMSDLDITFGFSKSGNSEIANEWLQKSIVNHYEPAYLAIENFLMSVGRRKFLKPIYKRMAETPDMLPMAKLIYAKARKTYHPISVNTIDAILGWE